MCVLRNQVREHGSVWVRWVTPDDCVLLSGSGSVRLLPEVLGSLCL